MFMDEEVILSQLEELAEKLEILVRDENINIEESSSTGGLCRVDWPISGFAKPAQGSRQ